MLRIHLHRLILQVVASFVDGGGGFPFQYCSHPLSSFHATPLDSYHQNCTSHPYHHYHHRYHFHHFAVASSLTFDHFHLDLQNCHLLAVAGVAAAAVGVAAAGTSSSSMLSLESHSTGSYGEVSTFHSAGSGSRINPSEACLKVHYPFHPNPSSMLAAAALPVFEHNDPLVQLRKLHLHHLQRMVYVAVLPYFLHPNPWMDRGNQGNFYDSCHHLTWKVPKRNFDVVALSYLSP
mmetsp:Transcript_6099/g.12733  ORF Transcript_6099/g.12733 Transcript_6099/m.12733 type:complete len:234 (-) Transcript_6099:907-1608(-)